ncbi:MAG TPA: acyltransferase [Gemmatimonadaceae bacterium]|nr:acyltransferase [Gemmatimonadaceae bacterium]
MSSQPSRSYGIDLLRGVACLAVVFFHYVSRGPMMGWMPSSPLPMLEPLARYGFLGVHLFFMISGYVILMSALGRTPRAFVASRVSRLYPALWAAATLTMLTVLLRGDSRFLVSWTDWAWNMTLIPQYVGSPYIDGAYWSLAVELQFYILVWLALMTGMSKRIDLLLWCWLGLSLLDAVRPIDPAERWLAANWAPLFTIGAATFMAGRSGWTRQRMLMVASSGLLALWHVAHELRRMSVDMGDNTPGFAVVAALLLVAIVTFMLFATGTLELPQTRWATLPGVLTYPLYLVHQVMGYVAYSIAVESGVAPLAAIALVLAGAVAISMAIHHFVERPLSPHLRRIVAPPSPVVIQSPTA